MKKCRLFITAVLLTCLSCFSCEKIVEVYIEKEVAEFDYSHLPPEVRAVIDALSDSQLPSYITEKLWFGDFDHIISGDEGFVSVRIVGNEDPWMFRAVPVYPREPKSSEKRFYEDGDFASQGTATFAFDENPEDGILVWSIEVMSLDTDSEDYGKWYHFDFIIQEESDESIIFGFEGVDPNFPIIPATQNEVRLMVVDKKPMYYPNEIYHIQVYEDGVPLLQEPTPFIYQHYLGLGNFQYYIDLGVNKDLNEPRNFTLSYRKEDTSVWVDGYYLTQLPATEVPIDYITVTNPTVQGYNGYETDNLELFFTSNIDRNLEIRVVYGDIDTLITSTYGNYGALGNNKVVFDKVRYYEDTNYWHPDCEFDLAREEPRIFQAYFFNGYEWNLFNHSPVIPHKFLSIAPLSTTITAQGGEWAMKLSGFWDEDEVWVEPVYLGKDDEDNEIIISLGEPVSMASPNSASGLGGYTILLPANNSGTSRQNMIRVSRDYGQTFTLWRKGEVPFQEWDHSYYPRSQSSNK